MSPRPFKKALLRLGFYGAIGVLLLYAVFPFYYAVLTSLKPSSALFQVSYWTDKADLSNYAAVLQQATPQLHRILAAQARTEEHRQQFGVRQGRRAAGQQFLARSFFGGPVADRHASSVACGTAGGQRASARFRLS